MCWIRGNRITLRNQASDDDCTRKEEKPLATLDDVKHRVSYSSDCALGVIPNNPVCRNRSGAIRITTFMKVWVTIIAVNRLVTKPRRSVIANPRTVLAPNFPPKKYTMSA